MKNKGMYDVTLRLVTIEHFFCAPGFTPFSQEYQDYSYTSGIEYIANELYAHPAYKEVHVTLVLPSHVITTDLEQQTKEAVGRYCNSQIKKIDRNTRGATWRAVRALIMALVALVIFISIGSQLTYDPSFPVQVLGQGMTVIGWVCIWFPLDTIVFGVWYFHMDRRIYEKLINMQLTIEVADKMFEKAS